MTTRPIFAGLSLLLIAGAIVLLFFVILTGAINSSPMNQVYFLQADTSKIPGAFAQSRWTLWNICGVSDSGLDANCGPVSPAFPFDPQNNFGIQSGIYDAFIGTSKFYYLTRFMFAFILIALFFAVCSLFLGLFALCSRIGSYLSSVMCFIAFFFQTLVAALMTANYVIGRDYFMANNQTASLGRYAFGFIWGAMACLLISSVLFCIAGSSSRKDSSYSSKSGFLGRKKSTRSRGSFIDNDASSFRRA